MDVASTGVQLATTSKRPSERSEGHPDANSRSETWCCQDRPQVIQSVQVASYITQPYLVSDPLMARRVDSTTLFVWILCWALVVTLASCGPPLTQPSSLDLSGHWTSVDHIGPVFNLEMNLSQNADGTITGTWASDVSPPHPDCPPELSARSNGTVKGTNTVVGVSLSILGIGDFKGQAIGSSTLHGSILSCALLPVTWTLAGPVPAG